MQVYRYIVLALLVGCAPESGESSADALWKQQQQVWRIQREERAAAERQQLAELRALKVGDVLAVDLGAPSSTGNGRATYHIQNNGSWWIDVNDNRKITYLSYPSPRHPVQMGARGGSSVSASRTEGWHACSNDGWFPGPDHRTLLC